jgi:NADH-quinone oxidoreductase subunit L
MVLPLLVLAVFSIGGGYVAMYPESLRVLIADWVPHPHGSDHVLMVVISLCASIGGLILARGIYGAGAARDKVEVHAGALYAFARSRFYFDEVYGAYIRRVQDRVADILSFLDTLFISGLLMRGSAGLAGLLGIAARQMHTGNVATYVWWFFAGLVLFGAYAGGYLGGLF